MEKTIDKVGWKAKWRIHKFSDADDKIASALHAGLATTEALRLYKDEFLAAEEWDTNISLNEGLQELIDIICGIGTPTAWSNASARIGVGDSNVAEAATQTGLQATTNKTFRAMDATYPQRSGQSAEWRATFGSGDANFAWEEYTVVNSADDTGKNLNRKTSSKGTKASGETWTLSLSITFA